MSTFATHTTALVTALEQIHTKQDGFRNQFIQKKEKHQRKQQDAIGGKGYFGWSV